MFSGEGWRLLLYNLEGFHGNTRMNKLQFLIKMENFVLEIFFPGSGFELSGHAMVRTKRDFDSDPRL
jgi:hypothetical protein